MKKIAVLLILTAGVYLCCAHTAEAQSKIVKKTVKKVILPPIAPEPAPTTVSTMETAPTPPPPPTTLEVVPLKKNQGLFGWGANADLGGFLQINRTGQYGLLAGRGDIIISDPLKMGEKIGLAEDAVEYKVGLGLAFGTDVSNNSMFSLPLFADTVVYLKEGSLFGMDPFIGGGLNFNLFGSGSTIGGMGGQFYSGVLVDFGSDAGKTAISLNYNSIKVGTIRAAEGFSISVSQPLIL